MAVIQRNGYVCRLWRKATLICWAAAALWLLAGVVGASAAHIDIVALGASNTAGKGVGMNAAWPAQLEALLRAKGYDVTIANAGVSGDTSAMILGRIDSAVPIGTKVVILQIGFFNDSRRGVSEAENGANIKAAIARARARGAKVVLVSQALTVEILSTYHQYDGIHLTEQGHALLAARLLPQVIGAIGKSR
jgi:acyl-CoA thioesterase I